jgi:hypothetical protein
MLIPVISDQLSVIRVDGCEAVMAGLVPAIHDFLKDLLASKRQRWCSIVIYLVTDD